jgi:hypothetical protein
MLLVSTVTLVAMLGELRGHLADGNHLLTAMSGGILVLDVWILLEGLQVLRGRPTPASRP